MQLNSFRITPKNIIFNTTLNPDSDDDINAEETRTVVCKEEPLDELKVAMSKLPSVVCEILALPKDYADGMVVSTIEISRTKHGTRSVKLKAKKNLDTIGGELHPIVAPFVKIDKPADGESGEVHVSKDAVKKINAALQEAERYAKGERSQQLINFEEAKAGLNAVADMGRDMFSDEAAAQ